MVRAAVGRLRALIGADFALALVGLAVTHVRISRAGEGWDWAPLWLATIVAVAPVLLAVRRMVPVFAALTFVLVAQLSLLLVETDWVMLAGACLALWTVARHRRLGPAVATLVVAAGVLPFFIVRKWGELTYWIYPQTFSETHDPDGTITTVWGIPESTMSDVVAGNWPWWWSGVLAAVWLGAIAVRRRAGAAPGDRRTPGERFDDLRAYLALRENRLAIDVVVAVALCGFTLLAIRRGQAAVHPNWWTAPGWMVVIIAYAPLSLVLRRIKPVVPCVLLAVTAYFGYWQVEDSWKLLVAFAVALYSLAAVRPVRLSVPVAVAVLGLQPVAGALSGKWVLVHLFPKLAGQFGPEWDINGGVGFEYEEFAKRHWPISLSLMLALPVCLGVLTRLYRRTAEAGAREAQLLRRTQEQEAEQRRLTERAHIARDLHDVIAHHVTLMVIQAEAGPDRLRRGDADVGFQRIGDAGRRALGELDRVLSALRDEHGVADPQLAPQPGLADLDRLVAGVDRSELAVGLEVRGDVEAVPDGHQLTAYRIVQEALTNVVRHAKATRVTVTVRAGLRAAGYGLEVEVTDDGAGFRPDDVRDNGRHGLAGMRERVKVHDGTLTIRSAPGAGTEVVAWLPIA